MQFINKVVLQLIWTLVTLTI